MGRPAGGGRAIARRPERAAVASDRRPGDPTRARGRAPGPTRRPRRATGRHRRPVDAPTAARAARGRAAHGRRPRRGRERPPSGGRRRRGGPPTEATADRGGRRAAIRPPTAARRAIVAGPPDRGGPPSAAAARPGGPPYRRAATGPAGSPTPPSAAARTANRRRRPRRPWPRAARRRPRGRGRRRRCRRPTCSAPTRSWSPVVGRSRRRSPPAGPRIACSSCRSDGSALEQLVLHATRLRIPIVEVEGGSLTALAGFDGHQGVALVVEPRRFATLDDILARAAERGEPPFVLVLDSLEDPQNVGTLLRSAEAAGVHGVDLPDPPPGAADARPRSRPRPARPSISCSARSTTCPARWPTSTPTACGSPASEADAPLTARQTDLRGPLAIVVGSEGQGLGPADPPPLRPVHADPDARRDRVAQRRGRRFGAAVRGGRAARSRTGTRAIGDRTDAAVAPERRPRHPGDRRRTSRRPTDRPTGRGRTADDGRPRRPSRRAAESLEPDRSPAATTPRPGRVEPDPRGPDRARRASRSPGDEATASPSHGPTRRADRDRPARPPGADADPAVRQREAAEPRARPALDPSARPALSFHGAERVICGMALPVVPT